MAEITHNIIRGFALWKLREEKEEEIARKAYINYYDRLVVIYMAKIADLNFDLDDENEREQAEFVQRLMIGEAENLFDVATAIDNLRKEYFRNNGGMLVTNLRKAPYPHYIDYWAEWNARKE